MLHPARPPFPPAVGARSGRRTARAGVLALSAVLLTPLQPTTPGAASSPGSAPGGTVALRSVDGQVREADVRLPARPATRTLRLGEGGGTVSMVGATWTGEAAPDVEVSVRREDGWSSWRELPVLEDGPTPGSSEATARRGTDLVWIRQADEVRVRTSGSVPDDLDLMLVDTRSDAAAPRARPAADRTTSRATTETTTEASARKKPRSAPQPRLRPRHRWGAKEKWRDGRPVHNKRMRQIHIHHTANGNDYSRADVPGIIRGIYRYHTKGLGWSDIGYNVLVDRFGRAWTGRFNGPRSRVRGAHTLGFNHNSTGVAVIGNYSDQRPHRAVVRVLSRIAAWQLDRHGRKAVGTVRMQSHGSDRYKKGRWVRLPVIDGHRHTNHTACPGDGLMKVLPTIRQNAQRRINRF